MSSEAKDKDDKKVGDKPSPEKVAEAVEKKSRNQRFAKGTEVAK